MVTVGRRAHDVMYRFGAPWKGADRVELRAPVQDGRCAPDTLQAPTRTSHIATYFLERTVTTLGSS